MKLQAVAWLAGGVVLGFVLGGIPARRQARVLQEERDALQAQLDAAERPNLLQAFLPRLGAPPFDQPESAPDADAAALGTAPPRASEHVEGPAPPRPAAQGDVAVIGAASEAERGPGTAAPSRDLHPAAPPGDRGDRSGSSARAEVPGRARPRRASALLSDFDRLVTAQRARMAASRAALVEQAELDDAQLARLDRSLERMNGKLRGYGEEAIAQAASEEPPSPSQALGLGHDVSGILYEAQQELDAVVGDAAERVDQSAREVWNYVDLEQWKPFVEQKLGEQRAAQGDVPSAAAGAGGGIEPPSE